MHRDYLSAITYFATVLCVTQKIKQLRDANNKLTSKLSEEEALRQKLEKQRKDDHTASTSTSKKLTLELSTLKVSCIAVHECKASLQTRM